ncbi:response regulator receiver sensor signal transduction histidine kinase [Candidatus Moduliflexus flocculans]|uniref:Response regulator receiver sensor signal transduction histidine kinase n=1 Tax=Candidatus Moduliflexus flocculans TaxID=1499966 RepID=A0A081BN98_9BACT|nr:response regulator receiver sensor signal transduction histidine kinase [Candidatus Moduliflexus flocculans]
MSECEKTTILLVDDRPENLFALGRIFEDSGYILLQAGSGYEALRIVLQTHIDLILLDVRMPGMDGYQTCERLKANERTRDIPVIFISALDDIRDKINGFKAGGVDYVTKPPQAEEVLARVNAHLAIRQL